MNGQKPAVRNLRLVQNVKKTEGEPLGHTWVEAACSEANHCSVCGETEERNHYELQTIRKSDEKHN